jgi:hypothetical protein
MSDEVKKAVPEFANPNNSLLRLAFQSRRSMPSQGTDETENIITDFGAKYE